MIPQNQVDRISLEESQMDQCFKVTIVFSKGLRQTEQMDRERAVSVKVVFKSRIHLYLDSFQLFIIPVPTM